MPNVTIYHNPKCGTSRNTLALIRHAGIEPEVIEYLKTPPNRETITNMVRQAGLTLREALREKGTPFLELGLDKPDITDSQLLDAIETHPILLNRPFVITEKGANLCRPCEKVLDLLPPMPGKAFAKEDGTPVLDEHGKRVI
ncbi:MAG: arsenate reductase (glutaredoxin) [Pusillimonas sp.]|nr:arsenate reductase (glutaredoxin) [Pusillimonas sp.]